MSNNIGPISNRSDRQNLVIERSIFTSICDGISPNLSGKYGGPHVLTERSVWFSGFGDAWGRRAHSVKRIITGLGKGRVSPKNFSLQVDNDYGIRRHFQGRALQAHIFLCLPARATVEGLINLPFDYRNKTSQVGFDEIVMRSGSHRFDRQSFADCPGDDD